MLTSGCSLLHTLNKLSLQMFLYIQCLMFVVTPKCYLKLNPQCGHDCMQDESWLMSRNCRWWFPMSWWTKSSYQHGSYFQWLRCYGHFLIPINVLLRTAWSSITLFYQLVMGDNINKFQAYVLHVNALLAPNSHAARKLSLQFKGVFHHLWQ